MHNATILELFPVPVYTATLPDSLATVIPFLDKQNMNTNVDEANYGKRSKDSYILNKPECSDLSTFILGCVQDFADNSLLYEYEKYRFSQSWISHKEPGQHHIMHTHPNSLISGVFYYGPVEPDTSAIKFHKMTGAFNQSVLAPKIKANKKASKFAWTEFAINFEPGLLILFPSWLHHSVPLNRSKNVRCSLAFNVVPVIGFGEEENLTELLF